MITKDSEKKTLDTLLIELDMLSKKNKIDESTLQSLNNMISTLTAIKENYYWRLLRNYKRDIIE
jgi:hypothetical protein